MKRNPIEALQEAVATAGSQVLAAQALGISPQYVSDLLAGRRAFSDRLLDLLGLERIVVEQNSLDSTAARS